jgi:predicted nucleic acid-binding protein
MKHYLVDTNVIIDLLLNREGADAAAALLDGAERGEYKLSLCSLSYTNIYYSLRKYLSHDERISCLSQLCDVLHTVPVDGFVVSMALQSGWRDFEDAVQYSSAVSSKTVDGIITRNEKDFLLSEIPVINPLEFLK